MTINKNKLIGSLALVLFFLVAITIYVVFLKDTRSVSVSLLKDVSSGIGTTTGIRPAVCKTQYAPDGSVSSICANDATSTYDALEDPALVKEDGIQTTPSAVGTIIFNKSVTLNDVLVAEAGSQYVTLHNARYTIFPYPGTITFKSIYVTLPDVYTPIFENYSDASELARWKNHVTFYLRHKDNFGVGVDATIRVQSPIATDETDHSIQLIESTDEWAMLTAVIGGKEMVIEVAFDPFSGISTETIKNAHEQLLAMLLDGEFVW